MENEWANDQSTWFTCNPFTFSLNIFWIDGLDLTRVSIRLFENNERKKRSEWMKWMNKRTQRKEKNPKKRYKSSKTLVRKTWQEMFPFMPVRSFVRLFPSHCCCCCGIFIRFWHAHYLKRKSLTELEFWIIAFECYVDLFFGCGRGTTKGYWRQWRWTTTHTESRIRTQNMILNSQNWFFFFGFLVYLFIHSNCIIGAWWFLFISHWIIIDIWRQSFHFILVKFWSLLVFFHWINFSFNQFSLSVCVFYVYISLWNIFQKKPAKIQTQSIQ